MDLGNAIKAPGSTLAGLAGGLGINLVPIPPTGNKDVDMALTIAQVVAGLIIAIWGALRPPKAPS